MGRGTANIGVVLLTTPNGWIGREPHL